MRQGKEKILDESIKRKGERSKKFHAVWQIVLMVSFSFSVAGILGAEFGAASGTNVPYNTEGKYFNNNNNHAISINPTTKGYQIVNFKFSKDSNEYKQLLRNPNDGSAWQVKKTVDNKMIYQRWNENSKAWEYVNADAVPRLESGGAGTGPGGAEGAGDAATKAAPNAFRADGGALGSSSIWTSNVVGAHLINGVSWGLAAYGIGKLVGGLLGMSDNNANAIGMSLGAGVFAWQGTHAIFAASVTPVAGQTTAQAAAAAAGWIPAAVGIGVGVAIFLLTYKKEKTELVIFECLPWEAPYGGDDCEICNEDPLVPCSEYRCKSLGQACEIVNKGEVNELCIWAHPDDVTAPVITPDEEILNEDLDYTPDTAVSPPHRGSVIVYDDDPKGCLMPYTPLTIGFGTDEPAVCKADFDITTTFDNMTFAIEGNSMKYEHKITLVVPDLSNQEEGDAPVIHNDGSFNFYVKCSDANENKNEASYSFRYCVQEGPDTTAPEIRGSSLDDESYISYDSEDVPVTIYVNEPAECRWSRDDKAYEAMENQMDCATEARMITTDFNYECSSTLTALQNQQDNNFYFRCIDLPWKSEQRNVMKTSYPLTLKGTEPLAITSVGPEGEIVGNTRNVPDVLITVETAHGAEEGKAECSISLNSEEDFSLMENTDSYEHNQSLVLGQGIYQVFFMCRDAGGNVARDNTTFNIALDTEPAKIARAYRDADSIKIITTEFAECAYSLNDCSFNFGEGEPMLRDDPTKGNIHRVDWANDKTYYIKCRDEQGNQPFVTSCSLIVSGSEL